MIWRFLTAFLCLSLTGPSSAFALRSMSVDNVGVKEKVRAGLEEPSDAEVQGVIQALVGMEGGSNDIWSAIIRIRSWYREPDVKDWRAVSDRAPDLMAALLFHAAPGGPEVRRDAWLALKEMNDNGVSAEVLGLPHLPSRTHLAWLTEVILVMQKDRAYWQLTSSAMTALVRGALHQTRLAADSDSSLRGTEDEVVRELTARTIESAIFEAGLSSEDKNHLNSILNGLRPDVAVRITPLLKGTSSGLEEAERMTAPEFARKYGGRVNADESNLPNLEKLLADPNVQVVVVTLPHVFDIFVQGKDLYWAAIDHLVPRLAPYRPEVLMPVFDIPTTQWNSPGVILKLPGAKLEQNPLNLPVFEMTLGEVRDISALDFLMMLFRERLEIPQSNYLGDLVFVDEEDKERAVFFFT